MAINKKKDQEQEGKKDQKYDIKVLRAHEFKSGDISFDVQVNGVTLYSLTYIDVNPERNITSPFVSFPSRKGSDGKYYNYCYFKITDDMLSGIEKQIEEVL